MPGQPIKRPTRVLHFVTGGFSGATQVAIDLVRASIGSADIEPLLVLRRKWQTPASKVDALVAEGLPVATVSGLAHAISIWQLMKICQAFKPDVLVAHGFPEHIIGRYAGLLAKVPKLIHVEHNSRERYTASRLWQAKWLAKRTDHIVGVSKGVETRLHQLGFPAEKITAIPNGIDLSRFSLADQHPFASRQPGIVMCARFSSQKDHLTAIRAMAELRQHGLRPPLIFAGGGKPRYLRQAEALVRQLSLSDQVTFMGFCRDVPALLMQHQICLLSTNYEGMPLALIEGMAAGCAVVASDVIGVKEVITDGRNGLLFPAQAPAALAAAIRRLLQDPGFGAKLATTARLDALAHHGVALMRDRHGQLLKHT